MALGGGTFAGQHKTLPGAYVNFVSLARIGAAVSERGAAAMALELDWGQVGEIFTVTNEEFIKNSLTIFGYDYSHNKMKGLRELFRNAKTLYGYRLGIWKSDGRSNFATCAFGTAKYSGIRGNDLSVVVCNASGWYTVQTLLDGAVIDTQSVPNSAMLRDNDFVVWNKEAALEPTSGMPFEGGKNPEISVGDYQTFLEKLENYSPNAISTCTECQQVNQLFAEYTQISRDTRGAKLQCVIHDFSFDHEGVVNVINRVIPEDGESVASLVYWVTGIIAGCAVNKSNLNKVYDGEYKVCADYTQSSLESAIKNGNFVLHKVGNTLRVLADINSLVRTSDEKGDVFKDNQTIRVIDQIANDIAALFNNKYLGNVANDEAGRISLWADIVKHHEDLERIRAIENFSEEDVEVEPGNDKRSVIVKSRINVVNAMAQVYMTCVIS